MDYQEPPRAPPVISRPAEGRQAPIPVGSLDRRAISMPQPEFPARASAARASGNVTVQVIVDETGRVISANATSGHPLLREAAVAAAGRARLSPTLLSGQPVKVTGTISYNFVQQ